MRGTMVFRAALGLGWLLLLGVTIRAISEMGIAAAAAVFFGDLAHPWRGQFETDFVCHMLLAASWMVYRARSWTSGIICAVLAINLGGMFTLGYLFVASIKAGGDPRKLLLGARSAVPAVS